MIEVLEAEEGKGLFFLRCECGAESGLVPSHAIEMADTILCPGCGVVYGKEEGREEEGDD